MSEEKKVNQPTDENPLSTENEIFLKEILNTQHLTHNTTKKIWKYTNIRTT
ncbi:MAG TPA: hypothetical protein VGP43_10380 [Chitinophagaceae bacterium]|nr:hypothetical protein [Chitinophagaceae bacterium]